MILEVIHELYDYNAWANQKILTQAAHVSPEDFLRDFPGVSFGSLRSTLAHTMLVQQNWLLRWQGQQLVDWPDLNTYPDFATIQTLWAEIETRTQAFVAAVARQDPAPILSGAEETLETHLMVFAAEEARAAGTVVDVAEFKARHAG